MGSNREKSNIAIAILEILAFLNFTNTYFAFWVTNNIFVDCNTPCINITNKRNVKPNSTLHYAKIKYY